MTETEKMYQNYYIEILKKARHIEDMMFENDIKGTHERNNLYLLAFMGLLHCRYSYKYKEEMSYDETVYTQEEKSELDNQENEKNGKLSKFNLLSKKKSDDDVEEPKYTEEKGGIKGHNKTLVMIIDEVTYECKESALVKMFGEEDFNEVLHPKKKKENKDNENVGYNIPPWDMLEGNDDIDMSEPNVEDETESEHQVNKFTEIIPIIESDNRYPDDEYGVKAYDSFLFNQHDVTVFLRNKNKRIDIKFIIYPMNMNHQENEIVTDILVIAETVEDRRIRVAASAYSEENAEKQDAKSVNISYPNCNFVVRGRWEEDEFKTSIVLMEDSTSKSANNTMEEVVTNYVPHKTARTSSFYQRIFGKDGTCIDVFPTELRKNNSEAGLAKVAVIYENGHERKPQTPTEGNSLETIFEGSLKRLDIYWEGNDLHCNIEPVKKKKFQSGIRGKNA